MANILQVSHPSVNTDNRTPNNQDVRMQPDGQLIKRPIDPAQILRSGASEEEQAGSALGEGTYSVIDYESNFGAFIQRLGEGMELPRLLEQLFFRDTAGFLFADQEAVGALVEQLLSLIQVETREELVDLFLNQQAVQGKFSGPFFDGLRNILSHNTSDNLKNTVMTFLKCYNDCSSGRHLLQQMKSLTDDISRLMLKHYEPDFRQLADAMDWTAKNGDTASNTELLNGRIIPFLSGYISRTHDFGAVRDAVLLFILHAVKYENGDQDKLEQLFERMTGSREFRQYYKGEAREGLDSALGVLGRQTRGSGFADVFSTLLLKGAGGEAGLDNIQQFYNIMNGMLLNESVYMPLLHILLPFRFRGKDVMSEMWADPDAESASDTEGRRIKMFLRFDVQNLGRFDLVLALWNRQVDMQLYVPTELTEQMHEIQNDINGILNQNGLELNRLLVREKQGELRLEDIFPAIREKERTINVRI